MTNAAKSNLLQLTRFAFALLGLFVFVSLAARPSFAVEGVVTGGKINPLPIAIPNFLPATPEAQQMGADVVGVVTADLQRSGYFQPVDPASFIEQITDFGQEPNFASWRQTTAKALVTGRVTMDGGRIKAEFRLWDTATGQQLSGLQFTTADKAWRRTAHKIADAIYSKLTGFDPYFDTRVVFVDESGPKNKRVKRLAIMDQDGANVRKISKGDDLVLTPRFSPNSQELTYMSFGNDSPRVYLLNIETGQREIVGEFPNMSFAPRFSPDGGKVILSLEENGNANIYALDLQSKRTQQLTNTPAINTAPSYAPDGNRIAFESDRGGGQQIYVMGSDGSNQQRISFGDGRYSTPVWSPDGQWIAFTKIGGGRFSIGVMKPDGSGERILTEGFHNEGPTWSPNSRVLMFFRDQPGDSGGPKLYSVDITGYNEQLVLTPGFASDPAWSPLLN